MIKNEKWVIFWYFNSIEILEEFGLMELLNYSIELCVFGWLEWLEKQLNDL